MTETMRSSQQGLLGQLARYGWAVGTGTLLSPLVLADGIDFAPLGGLPIVIDDNVTIANPVEFDLNDDAVNDFAIFHTDSYGGGFQIETLYNPDSEGDEENRFSRVQYNYSGNYYSASRNDLTEFISVDDSSSGGNYYPDYQGGRQFIHANGSPPSVPAYTPFRNNPGFLGLSMPAAGNSGYAGTIKVEVNSAGTELTILGGSYRQDGYDIYLDDGILFKGGFESPPQSAYFSIDALQQLAAGSED